MNYTVAELEDLGISVGRNPKIHKTVLFFNPEKIVIGHHVRIDCFAMLSAGTEGITIGRNVHIAPACLVFGAGDRIVFSDFSGLSARVSLFTSTDDYSQGFLTNPTVPDKYKLVKHGPIVLEQHAVIGAGSVILPGVTLGRGSSVGAMSLIHKSIAEYSISFGVPARVIGRRDPRKLEELEKAYVENEGKI